MKRYIPLLAIAFAVVFAPATSSAALAPKMASAESRCSHSIKVAMQLTARLVFLPDSPAFAAGGRGELCYELGRDGARVRGESVPRLTFEALDPPEGFRDLAVTVDGMPGTWVELDWSQFPEIRLAHLDLRVRGFELPAAALTGEATPFVDIILSDLALSTAPITVEGVTEEGFLDAETLTAKLVGKAVLPDADDPRYQEWLANQDVFLGLRVQIENPFQQRK